MPRLLPSYARVPLLLPLLLTARPAYAVPPSPELMEKLARYGEVFTEERNRASYSIAGRVDVLDGDGKVDSYKEGAAHVEANGGNPRVTVLHYVEDGQDKTSDAVDQAREADEKRRKRKKDGKELKLPVLASQQGRYVFDETERTADGSRVRISFVPKEPAEDTIEGSAWVDADAGTVVSASFKVSRTSFFVKYIHIWVDFGEHTPIGPAVSKVTIEGEGGVLFIHKHFRGSAVLSGYTLAP